MERLTYDFCIGGNHCWQVKGADNLECREVCERQGDDGCKTCPIAKAFDRLASIEDILGDKYDLDELKEVVQAKREGRCVVLPCKVGDVVYEIRYTAENIRPGKHSRKKFDHSVSGCTWRMRACPDMCYVSEKKCTKSDFSFMGRTVFLTRAEAEEALKAREQDG